MFKLIGEPGTIRAGQAVQIIVRYIHDGPSLGKGASIRIGYNITDGAGLLQTDKPDDINYLAVKAPANVDLCVTSAKRRRSITHFLGTGMCDMFIFEINIVLGQLNCHDSIDIIMGNPDKGFLVNRCSDSPLEFFYHIDHDGRFPLKLHHPDAPQYFQYLTANGAEYPEWRSSMISIVTIPDEPILADIILPNVIVTGDKAFLRIVVYDRFYNHLQNYQDSITLLTDDALGIQIRDVPFSTGNQGYALIPISFKQPIKTCQLQFHLKNLGRFRSNPISVCSEQRSKIYWGELHGHSCLSDGGCRDADYFFGYARNIRGLDFAALADHTFGLAVKHHWQALTDAVVKHSQENEFLALLGYEIMTDGLGHRNIYFPSTDAKLVMADVQPGSGGSFSGENIGAYKKIWDPNVPKALTTEELLAQLKGHEFIWTAHHCGRIHPQESQILRLYEACSEWGVSDTVVQVNTSTTKLTDIFSQGLSCGLTGGSDDHKAKAGFQGKATIDGPIRYPAGLTAVICNNLDRASIYQALKAKRCYATTGARILINIKVKRNGLFLKVELEIAGTDVLDRILVFKNGLEVYQEFLGTENFRTFYWKDEALGENDNCFIRICQMDGQMAWINPLPFASD